MTLRFKLKPMDLINPLARDTSTRYAETKYNYLMLNFKTLFIRENKCAIAA